MTDLGPLLSATSGAVLPLCYILFQICTSWLLLSTLTATVVNTMFQFTDRQTHEDDFQKRKALHARLSELFDGIQVNGYDEIQYEELQAFLATPGSAETLQSIADMSAQKACIIWEAMQVDGAVNLDKYIDQLARLASDSLESSILRVEIQIGQVYELLNQYLPVLFHTTRTCLSSQSARPDATDLPADQSGPARNAIIAPVQQSSNVTRHLPPETLDDVQVQQLCRMLSVQLRGDLASAVATISSSAASAQHQQRRCRMCEKQNLPRLLRSERPAIAKVKFNQTMYPG